MACNVYLIGMPGCGKSTLGRALAGIMHARFEDTDSIIETFRPIKEIFQNDGEEAFRNLETEVLKRISHKKATIVSTGGGIVLRNENVQIMKASGIIVFIDRLSEEIIETADLNERPLLKGEAEKVYKTYGDRIYLYRDAADFIIRNSGELKEVLNNLHNKVKEALIERDAVF